MLVIQLWAGVLMDPTSAKMSVTRSAVSKSSSVSMCETRFRRPCSQKLTTRWFGLWLGARRRGAVSEVSCHG